MALIKIPFLGGENLDANLGKLNSMKTITGGEYDSMPPFDEITFNQVCGVEKFQEGEYFLIVNDFDEEIYDAAKSVVCITEFNAHIHLDRK